MREIDSPSVFRCRRCRPPDVLVIRGGREVVQGTVDAYGWWLGTKDLARDGLRLRDTVDRIRERAVVFVGECEHTIADERCVAPPGLLSGGNGTVLNGGPWASIRLPENLLGAVWKADMTSHHPLPFRSYVNQDAKMTSP